VHEFALSEFLQIMASKTPQVLCESFFYEYQFAQDSCYSICSVQSYNYYNIQGMPETLRLPTECTSTSRLMIEFHVRVEGFSEPFVNLQHQKSPLPGPAAGTILPEYVSQIRGNNTWTAVLPVTLRSTNLWTALPVPPLPEWG